MSVSIYKVGQLPRERINGGVSILSRPGVSVASDVRYVPASGDLRLGGWGLFDSSGTAIQYSIPMRGKGERPFHHVDTLTLPPSTRSYEGSYFYLGQMDMHYGHFLVEGLSRSWAFEEYKDRISGVVYHGPRAMMLRCPFIQTLLYALGIGEEDLIRPLQCATFEEMVIPEPAFQARSHIYREIVPAFAVIRRGLGFASEPGMKQPCPLYLSRAALSSGTIKVLNERELEESLSRKGLAAFYPEQHVLEEQIATLDSHSELVGWTGSAFHTLLLLQARKSIKYISPGRMNSNYYLIDMVLGNEATYFFPTLQSAKYERFKRSAVVADVDELVDCLTVAG